MNESTDDKGICQPIGSTGRLERGVNIEWPVDLMLYANNYEQVDDDHPILERIHNVEQALDVFRQVAAMAKGTTSATGLVHSSSPSENAI